MIEYINEKLDKIDKAKGKDKEELLKQMGAVHPLNMILSLNFDEHVKLDVPEGVPPYKRDEATHPDLFPTTLQAQLPRLRAILKGNRLKRLQKEAIFIQVLEGIPPKEADVLLYAKDRALTELYPTITKELVKKIFPNYCRELPKSSAPAPVQKKK